MSALTMTLLPEPVAPAISRCGILARSTAWALPATSRPEREGQPGARGGEVDLLEDPPQADDVEVLVRDLDADRALARDRRLDAQRAGGEGHRQVVGEGLDPADLDVGRRLDLVLGHDRAGVAAGDLGRDVEAAQLADDDLLVAPVGGLVAAGVERDRDVVEERGRGQDVLDALAGRRRIAAVGDVVGVAQRSERDIGRAGPGSGPRHRPPGPGRTSRTSGSGSARRPGCRSAAARRPRPRCRSGRAGRRSRRRSRRPSPGVPLRPFGAPGLPGPTAVPAGRRVAVRAGVAERVRHGPARPT